MNAIRSCALLIFAGALACGGKLDDGDGGTPSDDGSLPTKDASPGVDVVLTIDTGPPTTTCTTPEVESEQGSDGSCEIAISYSCGATSYSAKCDCPAATCDCSEQSNSMGSGVTVSSTGVCPTCGASATEIATICGFPH
jgi:hypothetical protein